MNQTKVFAHRGFSSQYPENTMAAFEAAVKANADGIELDVQLTLDEVPVVIHDETLDRTTSGSGLVQSHTVEEIKKLSSGAWFSQTYKNEQVPTLEEVLVWSKDQSIVLNIELKGQISDRYKAASIIFPLIEKHGLEEQVIISSFDHKVIALCKEQAPMLETAIIVFAALFEPVPYLRKVDTLGYHFYYKSLLNEEIEDLIKRGIRLRPYTVNDDHQIKKFIQLGCEAIITDHPKKAVDIRRYYYNQLTK
ncbi:glycerophosphodiester phosphodiesterase [Halalkalibacter alkaliphilus]|uniref:Glycerophosphodiester phosphodiesterase n=1 Tax=Halalkalibacter alkaliphilus TaxID=2917993 RepID=A0A9X2CRW3_9BACI|nr:glycerophosphodiester phosphodiesterase [Halalkalibacter alkaliphilus]MCL7747064.1 glycerophosphodiester phosphodiesterase [Halalkalibacter alkaliphilus]